MGIHEGKHHRLHKWWGAWFLNLRMGRYEIQINKHWHSDWPWARESKEGE